MENVSPKSPVQFILWSSTRSHMYGKEKLLEVNEAVVIRVKSPKHMITELLSIPSEEAGAIDLHERVWRQLAVRTIFCEPLVPLNDGVNAVVGVCLQELQVLLWQTPPLLGCFCPHCIFTTEFARGK